MTNEYFNIEDIPQSPEETNMQKSKEAIIESKQKEQEQEQETDNKSEQKEIKKDYYSLFYPAIQGLQDYVLKEAELNEATKEDKEFLLKATTDLEIKYSVNKINNEESRFIVAFITPIAKNYNKFYEWLTKKINEYRNRNNKSV